MRRSSGKQRLPRYNNPAKSTSLRWVRRASSRSRSKAACSSMLWRSSGRSLAGGLVGMEPFQNGYEEGMRRGDDSLRSELGQTVVLRDGRRAGACRAHGRSRLVSVGDDRGKGGTEWLQPG